MNRLIHHHLWLWRRFKAGIMLNLLFWSCAAFAAWKSRAGHEWIPGQGERFLTHLWFLLPGTLIWLAVLWQDQVPGTSSFWRTRPVRWHAMLGSQLMFLLVIAAGPLVCWAVNGLMLDNSAGHWRMGLWDVAFIICPLLAVAGICSFVHNWYGLIIGLIVATLLWFAGFFLTRWVAGRVFVISPGGLERLVAIFLLLPAMLLTAAWIAGIKSGRVRLRALLLSLALLILPATAGFITSRFMDLSGPPVITLYPAGPAGPGTQNALDLQFRNVRPGTWPVIWDSDIKLRGEDKGPPGAYLSFGKASFPAGQLPADAFTPLLPANTRWYHQIGERRLPRWGLPDRDPANDGPAVDSLTGELSLPQLTGIAQGGYMSPQLAAGVALAHGAGEASNGIRLSLRDMKVEPETLTFTLDVYMASALGVSGILPLQMPFSRGNDCLFVALHFPAAGMALLLPCRSENFFFSWQTNVRTFVFTTPVPRAERLLGIAYTPGILKDARVHLGCLRCVQEFAAAPSGGSPAWSPFKPEAKGE